MIARLLISPLQNRIVEIAKIINLPKSHPDLLYFPAESKLGIAEARKIKKHFSLKPYSAEGRAVVLEDASNLTIEAQNALLKTLEEPPAEAILILGASSEARLLPTILSRCQIIRIMNLELRIKNSNYEKDIEKLLESSTEERFEFVEKLKDREEFLHALIQHFHNTHLRSDLKGPTLQDFLRKLLQAEEWAAQNVSIRAILEYLMLVMPQDL